MSLQKRLAHIESLEETVSKLKKAEAEYRTVQVMELWIRLNRQIAIMENLYLMGNDEAETVGKIKTQS